MRRQPPFWQRRKTLPNRLKVENIRTVLENIVKILRIPIRIRRTLLQPFKLEPSANVGIGGCESPQPT
jgi:hypothetical protein